MVALAHTLAGATDEAQSNIERYERDIEGSTHRGAQRRVRFLHGMLSRASGNTEQAIASLGEAESRLSAGGFGGEHAQIWFALAQAHMEAGQHDQARQWFQRILDSPVERLFSPVPYVRSFYFLGKIDEEGGEMDQALEHYRRFFEFWQDGDLDRDRIAEVEAKIG